MREEERNAILEALDEVFRAGGVTSTEDGIRKASESLRVLHEYLARYSTREALCDLLDRVEWTAEEREMAVAAAEYLPALLAAGAERFVKQMTRDYPAPQPGRPRALTQHDEKRARELIGYLFTNGVSLKDAKLRAAQRLGVSLMTVERAWRDRKKTVSRKPSFEKVKAFFARSFAGFGPAGLVGQSEELSSEPPKRHTAHDSTTKNDPEEGGEN